MRSSPIEVAGPAALGRSALRRPVRREHVRELRLRERDEHGGSLVVYELEAEPEAPLTHEQTIRAAKAIGHLMEKAGLVRADQDAPASTRSWAYTEHQLNLP